MTVEEQVNAIIRPAVERWYKEALLLPNGGGQASLYYLASGETTPGKVYVGNRPPTGYLVGCTSCIDGHDSKATATATARRIVWRLPILPVKG